MKMLLFPFSDLLLLLYRKSNHKYIYLLFPIVANIGTVIVTVINTAIILFVLPAREGLPESEGVSMFSFVRASHIMAVSFDSLSLNAHRGKVSLTLPRWKCRKKNCSTEYFQICEITWCMEKGIDVHLFFRYFQVHCLGYFFTFLSLVLISMHENKEGESYIRKLTFRKFVLGKQTEPKILIQKRRISEIAKRNPMATTALPGVHLYYIHFWSDDSGRNTLKQESRCRLYGKKSADEIELVPFVMDP